MAMIPLKEAAVIQRVSVRRMQTLCAQRRVPGAKLIGRTWWVPEAFWIRPGKRGPSLRA